MTNNAAESELPAIAVGRRNWTFAGSDEGGRRAAALYTLSPPPSSTTSIPKPGSPMSWHGCWITPQSGLTTYCRGTGIRNTERPPDNTLLSRKGQLFRAAPPHTRTARYLGVGWICISSTADFSSLLSTVIFAYAVVTRSLPGARSV
jgi:Transposase IS66 family